MARHGAGGRSAGESGRSRCRGRCARIARASRIRPPRPVGHASPEALEGRGSAPSRRRSTAAEGSPPAFASASRRATAGRGVARLAQPPGPPLAEGLGVARVRAEDRLEHPAGLASRLGELAEPAGAVEVGGRVRRPSGRPRARRGGRAPRPRPAAPRPGPPAPRPGPGRRRARRWPTRAGLGEVGHGELDLRVPPAVGRRVGHRPPGQPRGGRGQQERPAPRPTSTAARATRRARSTDPGPRRAAPGPGPRGSGSGRRRRRAAVGRRPAAVERTRNHQNGVRSARAEPQRREREQDAEAEDAPGQPRGGDEPDDLHVLVVGDLEVVHQQAELVREEPERRDRGLRQRLSPSASQNRETSEGRQRPAGPAGGLGREVVGLAGRVGLDERGRGVGPRRLRARCRCRSSPRLARSSG